MARRCFFSFHYEVDSHRAAQVRSIGVVEGNPAVSDNHWESIKAGGNAAIRRWIDKQLQYRSCTIVLVGARTANRKWLNYEIEESWGRGMGIVGIRIHGLKDLYGRISLPGANPFDYVNIKPGGLKLSQVVRLYNPSGTNSKERYAWIKANLASVVEDAIGIRKQY